MRHTAASFLIAIPLLLAACRPTDDAKEKPKPVTLRYEHKTPLAETTVTICLLGENTIFVQTSSGVVSDHLLFWQGSRVWSCFLRDGRMHGLSFFDHDRLEKKLGQKEANRRTTGMLFPTFPFPFHPKMKQPHLKQPLTESLVGCEAAGIEVLDGTKTDKFVFKEDGKVCLTTWYAPEDGYLRKAVFDIPELKMTTRFKEKTDQTPKTVADMLAFIDANKKAAEDLTDDMLKP